MEYESCPRTFKEKYQLKNNECFPSKRELILHKKDPKPKLPVESKETQNLERKCMKAKKKLKLQRSRNGLKKSMKDKDENCSKSNQKAESNENYSCKICKTIFSSKSELLGHKFFHFVETENLNKKELNSGK